jgi:glycosyltransferase involved in cell wall biosynthesis
MVDPRVEIVIPVYNGELHLSECLGSVLAQTYSSWTALVVNNCSTDRTAEIAEQYAARDARVRVMHCNEFLSQAGNYNRAIAHTSDQAAYIKVLEADNWITEDSIARMVDVGEANERVGVIGSYSLLGKELLGGGVDHSTNVLSGVEVWRLLFCENKYILGMPTTLLFRANALRALDRWFRSELFYDDVDLCFRLLRKWQYGFVHQVLAFVRVDNDGIFSGYREFDYFDAFLHFLAQDYGEDFMEGSAAKVLRTTFERAYYRRLAHAVFSIRGRRYWEFNKRAFRLRGERIRVALLLEFVVAEFLDLLLNPKTTVERLWKRVTRHNRVGGEGATCLSPIGDQAGRIPDSE